MNYEDKILNSVIVRKSIRSRKSQGLATKDKRLKGIILFILLAAYTIFSNIIIKNVTQLSATLILIIINLVTFCMLTFINKSIFSKSHVKLYKIVRFINKTCKVLIFAITLVSYNDFFIEFYDQFKPSLQENGLSKEMLLEIFKYDPIKWLSFTFSVILAIPNFIYFFIIYIKIMPPIGFFYYIIWLFSNPRIFYQYEYYNEEKVVVITRRIKTFGYSFITFIKKIFISIGIVILFYVSIIPILSGISELLKSINLQG